MRTQLIAGLFCALMLSLAVSAQQDHDTGVRTHCRILYAQPIKTVQPTYPALALQARVQGRVTLNCVIGLDGSVEKIKVQKGHALLIQAATEAISQWKVKRTIVNGKAVKTETVIDVDFQIPKKK